MSKDRLKELQKAPLWSAVSYEKLPQLPIDEDLSTIPDAHQQTAVLPTDKELKITQFLHETLSIRSTINRIGELTQQVEQIHCAMLQPTAVSTLAQQLDETTEEIKKLSYEISTKLKKLEQAQIDHEEHHATSAQWRIRESQIFTLTRRFRDTMIDYNKEAVQHRDRCKRAIARELEISGNSRSYEEVDEMLDSGFPGTFTFSIMINKQSAQHALDEIEARHRDITKLEKSIKELHNMFSDLAILVADQGEMVDNIEHNVSKAGNFVEDAAEDTYTTVRYHKKALKTKLVILMIMCVGAILLGLFLLTMYFTRKKSARG